MRLMNKKVGNEQELYVLPLYYAYNRSDLSNLGRGVQLGSGGGHVLAPLKRCFSALQIWKSGAN